jgi:hypothetical protein
LRSDGATILRTQYSPTKEKQLVQKRNLGIIAAVTGILVLGGLTTANAAATITGQDIVNGTIESRDIKNGTIGLHDIGPVTQAALKGNTGEKGDTGAEGPAGADSVVPGPEGPTGPEGPAGAAGEDGADSTVPGPDGPPGADGLKGDTGADGVDGENGQDGADGEDGAPGVDGEDGVVAPVYATFAANVVNIGGTFKTQATLAGTQELPAGKYILTTDALFRSTDGAPTSGRADLQVAVRVGWNGVDTFGTDLGTGFTGSSPIHDEREVSTSTTRVVTLTETTTVQLLVHGYDNAGQSSPDAGRFNAEVYFTAVPVQN